MTKIYKVQKYIQGWGWSTVGETPLQEQANKAAQTIRTMGKRARVVEEEV